MPSAIVRYLQSPLRRRPNGASPLALILDPTPETMGRVHAWAERWSEALGPLEAPEARSLGAALAAHLAPWMGAKEGAAWRASLAGDDPGTDWRDEAPLPGPPRRGTTSGGIRWQGLHPGALLSPLLALSRATEGRRAASLATLLRLAVVSLPASEADVPGSLGPIPKSLARLSLVLARSLQVGREGASDALRLGGRRPLAERIAGWSARAAEAVEPSPEMPSRLARAIALFDPAWGEAIRTPASWASGVDDADARPLGRETLRAMTSIEFPPRRRDAFGAILEIDPSAERKGTLLALIDLSEAWSELAPFAGVGWLYARAIRSHAPAAREDFQRARWRAALGGAIDALASHLEAVDAPGDARARALSLLDLPSDEALRGATSAHLALNERANPSTSRSVLGRAATNAHRK